METVQIDAEKELPADGEKQGKIPWHTTFFSALRLEFYFYLLQLNFVEEHYLSNEPLRIDVLIIKNESGIKIEKNIGLIFEDYNIFEFKSVDDSLVIKNYIKVMGYAYIYASFKDVPLDNITISFVCNPHSRKLFNYLENERNLTVREVMDGIYYVEGDVFKIQVLECKKLSEKENLFLRSLRKDLTPIELENLFEQSKKYEDRDLFKAFLARIVEANVKVIKEAMRMITDPETIEILDEVIETTGLKEKYLSEGKAEGKAEGKLETALNMLQDSLPVYKIAEYVGMPVSWVTNLAK